MRQAYEGVVESGCRMQAIVPRRGCSDDGTLLAILHVTGFRQLEKQNSQTAITSEQLNMKVCVTGASGESFNLSRFTWAVSSSVPLT